jgi:hypothetical protein
MATIQAVNVLTGTTELPKYNDTGVTTEIWKAATTTALAAADTIVGPSIPAGCYVTDVAVAWTDVDSATSFAWECGYTGTLGAFVATGNTTGQANGIQHANVAGALGYTAATDTQVLVTITASAGTPVAGTCTIAVSYTASP